jgi:hypothetical protein
MAETVAVMGGGQVSPEEYMRYTLRLCLEKRQQQRPCTREALAYAEQCREKAAELEAAIAANNAAAVRAILDWTKATHAEFIAAREA